jgi:hypothetical protein
VPILRSEGLATARSAVFLRAADGTLLEIFEWASQEAVERAHHNPRVQALWERFSAVSDCVKLADIPETHELFAHFTPVD